MSGKYSKLIRKTVNKKITADLGQAVRNLSKENLYWRLIYAFRIIFKFHPDIKFIMQHKNSK